MVGQVLSRISALFWDRNIARYISNYRRIGRIYELCKKARKYYRSIIPLCDL